MVEELFENDERRRRRTVAVVTAVALLVLLACGALLYPRLEGLLRPQQQEAVGPFASTNDVAVTRGPLTQMMLLAGSVEPQRTAKLSFRTASGTVSAVYVVSGDLIQEGQPLVELDAAALQRELAKVRGELAEAKANLDKLRDDRGLSKRIALEQELSKARLNLEATRRELELLSAGKGTLLEKRAKAAARLGSAQEALVDLREGQQHRDALERLRIAADLAEIEHGPAAWVQNPSEEDLDRAWLLRIAMLNTRDVYNQALLQHEMDIRAAEHTVAVAGRELRDLDDRIAAGSSAVELDKRKASVMQAEARVRQLQDQLRAMDEGTPDPDVAKAQAQVVKLEGRLTQAEASLQEARLVAPFSGVVGEVRVVPGATIVPGSELVTLYSAVDLRVVVSVNEMDVEQLVEGTEVLLGFDAFPGESLTGRLGEIPRYGVYQNGLTVYRVYVKLDPRALALRAGMSATVSVPLGHKDNVLRVPTMAVQYDAEGPFVLVVKEGKPARRSVQIGISDGIQTEIISGVQEGDIVRVQLFYPIGPMYR